MDIQLIKADIQHADAIAPLFDAYRIFYGKSCDLATARAFIGERLERNESVIFYARDAEQRPVGFTQLYPIFSSLDAQRSWLLNDLYVSETVRGQGVGRLLLNAARAFAIDSGAVGIMLETGRGNLGAQRLYESLGYVRDEGYYTYWLGLPVRVAAGSQ
ncbi:N-acetyltransferase family protein [Pseudomonas putida]